jgi:hypothetical protein
MPKHPSKAARYGRSIVQCPCGAGHSKDSFQFHSCIYLVATLLQDAVVSMMLFRHPGDSTRSLHKNTRETALPRDALCPSWRLVCLQFTGCCPCAVLDSHMHAYSPASQGLGRIRGIFFWLDLPHPAVPCVCVRGGGGGGVLVCVRVRADYSMRVRLRRWHAMTGA